MEFDKMFEAVKDAEAIKRIKANKQENQDLGVGEFEEAEANVTNESEVE